MIYFAIGIVGIVIAFFIHAFYGLTLHDSSGPYPLIVQALIGIAAFGVPVLTILGLPFYGITAMNFRDD